MDKARAPTADAGNIVGNVYDKYGTKNPIARYLMRGFTDAVLELYRRAAPQTVLEVGCGEGKLADTIVRAGPRPARFEATDVELPAGASPEGQVPGVDPLVRFRAASIYELPHADKSVDLVVCCEVLEHLERPAAGLAELARVARGHVLISTPWEPVWRALNVARGKYLRALGNTPGHIQHFSRRALVELARSQLRALEVRRPLPWTVILGVPAR